MHWSPWIVGLYTLAEEDPAAPPGGGFTQIIMLFVLIYFVVYFMMIRPQRKEQSRHQQLLAGLKKNDQVRTSAGILGKVVTVETEKDQVVLKIDEQNNVRMRVVRSSIVAIQSDSKKEAPVKG